MMVMSPFSANVRAQSGGEQLLGTESVTEIEVEILGGQTTLWTGDGADIAVSVVRRTWEVWEVNGVEENRNVQVMTLPATLDAWINEGDGAVTPSNVTTDANGHAVLNFTMGYGAAVVMIQATTADGAQPLATVNFDSADSGQTWDQTWDSGQTWDQTWDSGQTWDQTWTQTWDQGGGGGELYHDRDEGYLVLNFGTSPDSSGSPVQLEVLVEYASWEVWADGTGYEEQQNPTLSPAYGAEIQWSVESGDATLDWSDGWTDSAGVARGAVSVGSETSDIRIDVSFNGTESAFSTLSVSPDDGGGDMGGEEQWTYVGQESALTSIELSVPDGTDELQAGEERSVTATVYETTWDVYESNWGNWSYENDDVHPAPWVEVMFSVVQGDGNVSQTNVTTDEYGDANVLFTMGSQDAMVTVADADGWSLENSVAFSISPNPWTYLETETSRDLSATVDEGTGPMVPDEQRTITAVVTDDSVDVLQNPAGEVLYDETSWSSTAAAGVEVAFTVIEGDSVVSQGTAVTDASGRASVTLTMGTTDTRIEVTTDNGGETVGDEVFLPIEEETWTWQYDEATITLTLSDTNGGTAIPMSMGDSTQIVAEVRYHSWGVWTSNWGNTDNRNPASGPAIGAQVDFSMESGGGSLVPGASPLVTDANGQATATFTMESPADPGAGGVINSVVRVDAVYSGGTAAGTMEFTPSIDPYSYVDTVTELSVTVTDNLADTLTAQVSVVTYELWQDDSGNQDHRNPHSDPAINAIVSFSGNGSEFTITGGSGATNNNGNAVVTYAASAASTVMIDATFAGMSASTEVTVQANGTGGGGTEDQTTDQGPDSTTDQGPDQTTDQTTDQGPGTGGCNCGCVGCTCTTQCGASCTCPCCDPGWDPPDPDPCDALGHSYSQPTITVTGGGAVDVSDGEGTSFVYGGREDMTVTFKIDTVVTGGSDPQSSEGRDSISVTLEVKDGDGNVVITGSGSGAPGSQLTATAIIPALAQDADLEAYDIDVTAVETGGKDCDGMDLADSGPIPMASAILSPIVFERDVDDGQEGNWLKVKRAESRVLPGQFIRLRLASSSLPGGAVVTDHYWTIAGGKFSDYEASTLSGRLTKLNDNPGESDFRNEDMKFYWSDAGNHQVTLRCTVDGQERRFQTRFTVVEPINYLTTTEKGTSQYVPSTAARVYAGHAGLIGATDAEAGIRFKANVELPTDMQSSVSGSWWCFCQIVAANRTRQKLTGEIVTVPNAGTVGVDNSFPFKGEQFPLGIPQSRRDAPATRLDPSTYQSLDVDEPFSTFLMFLPQGGLSKWVPLKVLHWRYSIRCERDGAEYMTPTPPAQSIPNDGVDTHFHPEWEVVHTNF